MWQASEDGPGHGEDVAFELGLDAEGNVYVTGYATNLSGNLDFSTVKYNSSGTRLWKANYDAAPNGNDVATDLALDLAGNAYVAGYSKNAAGNDDYLVIKYNASGAKLWAARYNPPANSEDRAQDVAADESGNVYVTGHSKNGAGNLDYVTVKYNAAGVRQWAARYNGSGRGDDGACRVLVDGSGNVFVAGYSLGANGAGLDYVVVNYNSTGVKQWVVRQNGAVSGADIAHDMALDILGNLFVTGASENAGGNTDFLTVKYSPVIPTAASAAPAGQVQVVSRASLTVPMVFSLEQNYPNPFNPGTVISFQLPVDSEVTLSIFAENGQLVRQLANCEMAAGRHHLRWNGRNQQGHAVAAGAYLYRLVAQDQDGKVAFLETKRMTLLK